MGSKRNSTVAQNLEFLRSDNKSREEKCKEFWKYLDEKDLLPPYKPPKLTEDEKQGTSSAKSTAKPFSKGPAFSCKSLDAKLKRPINKDTKPKKDFQQGYFNKIDRSNTKPEKCEQSFEDLLAEMRDYEKRIGQVILCPLCNKEEACVCCDNCQVDQKPDEKPCP